LDKAITDRRLIDSTGRTVWVRSYKSAVRHGDSRLILVCLQDMGEWHYRLDQLDHAATHDELTGLLNRAGLTKEVERILGQGLSGRLAVIDLNGLKSVNDAHGHAAGDVVLKATAAQLSAARSGSRLVGRLGGDEFVMVDCGSAEELRPVLAKALAAEIPLGPGLTTTLSASIGEAAFGPGSIFDEVLHAADREMYRHKRARALSSGRSVLPQARAGEDDEWDTIELPLAREAY
jgi:diguanylate cyclase (GGDEF)-like protein